MTERSKQLKSAARDKRNNLLAGLAKIRGGHVTRSETLDIKEEEDVFDMVDEDEYQKLVEDRRKNTDFVVDDGEGGVRFFQLLCNVSCVMPYFISRRKPWLLR